CFVLRAPSPSAPRARSFRSPALHVDDTAMTPTASPEKLQKIVLLILAGGITLVFLWMIRQFLVALLLAAILSAMFQPLYGWLVRRFRGRRRLASAITIGIV